MSSHELNALTKKELGNCATITWKITNRERPIMQQSLSRPKTFDSEKGKVVVGRIPLS